MRNGHSVNLYSMAGPGNLNDNRRPLDRDEAKAIFDALPHGETMELLNEFVAENQAVLRVYAEDGEFCQQFEEYAIAQLIFESRP